LARRSADVLRGAAALGVDHALRLTPLLSDLELIPNLSIAAFDEIEAIRIPVCHQFDRELPEDPVAVSRDEAIHCCLDLKELCTRSVFGGQMEKEMAMDDVGVGLALAAPDSSQATGYATTNEVLVEALPNFGKALAIGIVKGDGARPVDCRVRD
jgi:hypothetical protein